MRTVVVSLAVERNGAEIELDAHVTFYSADRYHEGSAGVSAVLDGARWIGRLSSDEEETAVGRALMARNV